MSKAIKLKSNDGKIFSVDLETAKKSETIDTMLADLQIEANGGTEDGSLPDIKDLVPIPNVNAKVLKKVLEWCEQHKNDEKSPETTAAKKTDNHKSYHSYELKGWDKEFLNSINHVSETGKSMLFDVTIAANYLHIPGLVDIVTKEIANLMKDKKAEEIRDIFKLTDPDKKQRGPTTKLTLQSSDGKNFLVSVEAAKMSVTIRTMLEDLSIENGAVDNVIKQILPIPKVDAEVLQKVIDWCEEHYDDDLALDKTDSLPNEEHSSGTHTHELEGWDKEFINSINSVNKLGQSMLFDIIIAANYLDIPGLNRLAVAEVARMMRGKSQDDIRDLFKLKNDKLVGDD